MGALESFVFNNPLAAYAILFGGMFLEGEAFFLVAAIFSSHGLLSWPLMLGTVFVGVILGDIAWYGFGRYIRNTKLGFLLTIKFSVYHEWLDKNFIGRYTRMAFYSKFIYYVNRLTPLIAGWHGLNFKRFLKLHFLAAIAWIAVMSLASVLLIYVGGETLTRWLLDRIEFTLVGFIAVFFLVEWLLKRAFSKRIKKSL